MSQGVTGPASTAGALASVSAPEKVARLDTSGRNDAPKPRSCVVCRSRKVRCDKRAPCSNCRRANIACVFPPTDRPPRWARRLDHSSLSDPKTAQVDSVADGVMERLHNLESLVKELSSQLEQAKSAANSAAGGSSGVGSPESSTHDRPPNSSAGDESVQNRFGRLVLQDKNQSRYVSSGFWSRVSDELESLKIDAHHLYSGETDISDDETTSGNLAFTQEPEQTPAARHGFLFGHNLHSSSPELTELHPLPSQIPFLLDVFSENVNAIIQIVHIPTVQKMIRDWRGRDMKGLPPAHEALMFSIYYAAVVSMEEDEIILNFGATKAELNLKYRQGLEHALARADFLNAPDLILVQAFVIFLTLVRRHDGSRFVWMMTGLAIRMGQALGLHRDGSHFDHLSPYEVEMRRRAWWVLCMLDVRASEDQGTDYTIAPASFDTRIPLNLNDSDMDPESKRVPQEHDCLSDMSVARVSFGICDVTRKMMAYSWNDKSPSPGEQSLLLNEMYQGVERDFLQYSTESGSITYWAIVTVTRLVMAKMSLLVYLPLLFSSKEEFTEELRTRLLISGIEVAEYNHVLNNEPACRHWRWAFQTYTHWYSIVYMMIEISRRAWSPLSERAWVALQSVWLIPTRSRVDKDQRIWVPLRRLMRAAREHRQVELTRLGSDREAAQLLEQDYQNLPIPSRPGPFAHSSRPADIFLKQWREVIQNQNDATEQTSSFLGGTNPTLPLISFSKSDQLTEEPLPQSLNYERNPQLTVDQESPKPSTFGPINDFQPARAVPSVPSQDHLPTSYSQYAEPATSSWLWSEECIPIDCENVAEDLADINMDMGEETNWYDWVESAKGVEWDQPHDKPPG